jgi:hypothetical protein
MKLKNNTNIEPTVTDTTTTTTTIPLYFSVETNEKPEVFLSVIKNDDNDDEDDDDDESGDYISIEKRQAPSDFRARGRFSAKKRKLKRISNKARLNQAALAFLNDGLLDSKKKRDTSNESKSRVARDANYGMLKMNPFETIFCKIYFLS